MKNSTAFISIIIVLILNINLLTAQRIYFPDYTSNEPDMILTHIDENYNGTSVGFIYKPSADGQMFINSGMYIEDAFSSNHRKYKLKSFTVDGSKRYVNHLYNVFEGEEFLIVFEFDALPNSLEFVNIKEPAVTGNKYTPWSWVNINLEDDKLETLELIAALGNEDTLLDALAYVEVIAKYYPNDDKVNNLGKDIIRKLIVDYGYTLSD